MELLWPDRLPVLQVRFARPTDQLDEVVRFYRDGLGLDMIGSFEHHAGYSGVMLGLPGSDYHLEFVHHEDGSPGPAPSEDNLIVFYLPTPEAVNEAGDRLRELGHEPVPPENPYWENGLTFADPDGWRVVFYAAPGYF